MESSHEDDNLIDVPPISGRSVWQRIEKLISNAFIFTRSHPLEVLSLVASLIALGFSTVSFFHQYGEHSDTLTYSVIRDAYSDFIKLDDLRAQYPYQAHLFETPTNYPRYRALVYSALKDLNQKPPERARVLLEEAAIAERIFSMFEHSYYQWKLAKSTSDAARVDFLDELDVRAVLEDDEGVVRSAARVAAARRDGEAERSVIGDRLLEVAHRDDDVVEGELHGSFNPSTG